MAGRFDSFVESIRIAGGLDYADAERVARYYINNNLTTQSSTGDASYNVKHGAFLDYDVLQHAAEQSVIDP